MLDRLQASAVNGRRLTLRARGSFVRRACASLSVDGASPAPPATDPEILVAPFRFFSADVELAGHLLRAPGEAELRRAAPLWAGVPVHVDHDDSAQALAGRSLGAEWHEGRTEGDAGGIEGDLEIDRVLQPRMARAVERGLLTDVSTVLECAWAPSHDLPMEQFWGLLGSTLDGRTVLAQITEILAVERVDLVHAGADPYARRLEARAVEETMPDETPIQAPEATGEARLLTALGVASVDEALSELIRLRAETVPRAELDALRAELARVQDPIRLALADGRITPHQAEDLRPLHVAAPEQLAAYLATLKAGSAVPVGPPRVADRPPAAPAADGPTEVQVQMAKRLGVDPVALAQRERENTARREARHN